MIFGRPSSESSGGLLPTETFSRETFSRFMKTGPLKISAHKPFSGVNDTPQPNLDELSPRRPVRPLKNITPYTFFIATLITVFICEFFIMMLLPDGLEVSKVNEAIIDACILSVMAVPFLYFLFLRPLQITNKLRLQVELEHAKTQEMDRIKGEFVSIAAHELRTPLAVIRGYAELLLMEKMFDSESRTEFAQTINKKTETMERLIDDLTDLNRIQSGKPLAIEKENGNMVAVVERVISDYRKRQPERPFLVTLPAEAVCFSFDPLRIEQVIDNLLSNATKYSAKDAPIEIMSKLDEGIFKLAIRDQGIGMSPEESLQVFEKFYRADTSDTSASGLGLGMAIVKELIDAHNGKIWIESQRGNGTTVHVTLPVG